MNERPSNEELEAMLSDAREHDLEPGEAAELALLADLLAADGTWVEPAAGLEDAVLKAVAGAPAATASPLRHTSRRRRLAWSAIPAAAVAAAVVTFVAVLPSGPGADYVSQLTATGIAPGAHASADIRRNDAGFRIELHPAGLSALGAGEYYQAWLKDANGTLVPVGTFSSSDGDVTLWSGVSPQTFTTLTVTIEKANNDQTSSCRRVLVGDVHPG